MIGRLHFTLLSEFLVAGRFVRQALEYPRFVVERAARGDTTALGLVGSTCLIVTPAVFGLVAALIGSLRLISAATALEPPGDTHRSAVLRLLGHCTRARTHKALRRSFRSLTLKHFIRRLKRLVFALHPARFGPLLRSVEVLRRKPSPSVLL